MYNCQQNSFGIQPVLLSIREERITRMQMHETSRWEKRGEKKAKREGGRRAEEKL